MVYWQPVTIYFPIFAHGRRFPTSITIGGSIVRFTCSLPVLSFIGTISSVRSMWTGTPGINTVKMFNRGLYRWRAPPLWWRVFVLTGNTQRVRPAVQFFWR